ncbi:MAG TPA: hypothetical protein VGL53_05825 [Bryobacteraceae bacterium]|jgi:hypothetical protein
MKSLVPILLLALTLTACQSSSDEPKITAIVGAKLIDGKGSTPIDHSIVLIQGKTIVKVGSQALVPLPKDAEVVDGLNQTVEPATQGTTIDAGNPANLVLKSDSKTRTMKDGQWQN